MPAPDTVGTEVSEEEWNSTFAALVHPLPRLFRAVLPSMYRAARGDTCHGQRIGIAWNEARVNLQRRTGAQSAHVQAVGVEVAVHNVQVNAIAQNFVDNPTYFPPDVQANPRFQERMKREVPLGRLVSAEEDAEFAAYLCSEPASCFVGQVFPVRGGWVAR